MSDAADPVLLLDGVTKKYGDFTAVREVSLQVPRGSIYGFLGPNGAGKTTTIRMILDIVKPTAGRVTVLGADSALKVRNRIGYLPEEKGLYKKMKAWAIVAYFARLKGLDAATAKRRAYELLVRYGLKDFANARCETLSKGMGQKVQVLASIAHEPEFVILDEPFSGLDPANQQVLESVVRDMAARGTTVIFSTHVMSHAERMCDRILLIARARKIFDGTVAAARNLIPRRVRAGGPARETLGRLPGVTAVAPVESEGVAPRWDLTLADGADPHELLRRCFRDGIELDSFEIYEPTLHDVFLHLVGDDAKVAAFR